LETISRIQQLSISAGIAGNVLKHALCMPFPLRMKRSMKVSGGGGSIPNPAILTGVPPALIVVNASLHAPFHILITGSIGWSVQE